VILRRKRPTFGAFRHNRCQDGVALSVRWSLPWTAVRRAIDDERTALIRLHSPLGQIRVSNASDLMRDSTVSRSVVSIDQWMALPFPPGNASTGP
jgi:hypothetical protein